MQQEYIDKQWEAGSLKSCLLGILPKSQMDLLFIQQTYFWEFRKLIYLGMCKMPLPLRTFFSYYNTVCNSKILSTTQVNVIADCLDQLWYMEY